MELKKEGRTVFFSTHILPDAETLCDRVAVLARGRLQGIGSVQELFEREVQGVEIVFEIPRQTSLTPDLASRAMRTGDRYRLEVGVDQV